ncbi:non-ribosomal peptide synthetase [Paucisalibacillus globulus]|uniref:non-ribosomal peptide synthetase n=1 Tax=Paucisalibacillus globulus TaxID=351095 RepID=UPI000423F0BB|nr:non-ribosomal peptide synthetase [Paucisalibacillus globulus]
MKVQIDSPSHHSQQVFELSKQETDVLENVNNVYNTETRELLLAALTMTISDWTNEENTLISLEANNRNWIKNMDVSRTVANFTSTFPVLLKTYQDISDTIKYTKDTLRKIPDNGLSYGLIKARSNVTLKPEILFNYYSQEELAETKKIFKTVKMESNPSLYPLTIIGEMRDGSLKVLITYHNEAFNDETMEGLSKYFRVSLLAIMEHCQKIEGKNRTITDLTEEDISFEELKSYGDDLGNIQKIYPLVPMQEGILYHALMEEDDPYNIVSSIQLEGSLDEKLLEKAFHLIIDRHDSLRTVFDYMSFKQNLQVVFKSRQADFSYLDISNLQVNKEEYLDTFLQQQKKKQFDVSRDNLIKLVLVKMMDNRYCIIFNAHHILMDGWCISIIVSELFKIYHELKHGYPANLKDIRPYSDYITWLKTKDKEQAQAYWRDYLNGLTSAVHLPFTEENKNNEIVNHELSWKLDRKQTKFIEELARKNKVSLNTVMQSVWAILLQKYATSEDIVYGYVVSGRNAEIVGVESILGLFINTVPLRVRITNDTSFTELLQTVSRGIIKNHRYEYLSLAEIQNTSELKNELINSLFVFENFPLDESELIEVIQRKNDLKLLDGGKSIFHDTGMDETNYNFTVVVTPKEAIEIKFLYNEKVYSTENVLKIKNAFEWIVDQVIQKSLVKVQEIDLIDPGEKNTILFSFNQTKTPYPDNRTLAELFQEQVKKTPNHTAVVYQNERLTYKELNHKANRLAHSLIEQGVEENHIIGMMVERSLEMIIGMLAILKAGGAYLPIDPDYPEDRIQYMLNDCDVQIILTDTNNPSFSRDGLKCLNILQKGAYSAKRSNPNQTNHANSLAYVIYTSGTTGKPKGVELRQKGIARLVKETNYLDITENDRLLQTGSITFDASIFEFWGTLLNGASLHISKQDTILDHSLLENYLKSNEITVMFLTTALFHKMCEVNPSIFNGLTTLITGGEVLHPKYVNRIKKEVPDLMLLNAYGPTENTTYSTIYPIHSIVDESKLVPIGKPISNTTAYILDSNSRIVPIGMEGELCFSGDGLARGYRNREELNIEKFVDNPYIPGQKMYRTGDKARWLPDGNIEFLGRMDQQVKIRGFRIEPGEIENTLMKLKGVKEAAVVCREEQGDKYLCAYFSLEKDYREDDIKSELKRYLPEYMIPAWFIKMTALPLSPNGKLDKKKLPIPKRLTNTVKNDNAPLEEAEIVIASIWESVLGVKNIGTDETFYSLGGDSIKGIQIIARMRNEGYSMELKRLAANPTIKELIEYVKKDNKIIAQDEVKGEVELTPIQKWFFNQEKLVKNHFNQELMLYSKEGFNQQWVQIAFDTIVKHHDILRAVFIDKKQQLNERTEKHYDLVVYDLTGREVSNDEIYNLSTDLQSSMDLEKGPLVKLGLFKTDKGDHLLIVIHHLLVDTVSWRIIVEDFDAIYSGLKHQKETVLPPKTTSFKEWALEQNKFATSYPMRKELEYWRGLHGHDMKRVKRNKETQSPSGHTISHKTVVLDRDFTHDLLTKVNRAYSTEINDILLAALVLTLGTFNQSDKLLLNLESHGREQLLDEVDITRTVGWFTSQYPVVLNKYDQLEEVIAGTKDTLRRIPNKGIGYGILKYLSKYELKEAMQPEVSFNYLGQFDQEISGENFTLSEIKGGESISRNSIRLYPLDFVGYVLNGEFNLTLNYSREEFHDESMEQLLQDYMDQIKLIISHCVSRENVEITVSDITDEAISLKELEPYQHVMDNIKSIYPLTPMQEGLIFHSLSDSGEAYHVSMLLTIIGDIDVDCFKRSFQELVSRHDSLRTGFDSSNFRDNMQVVYKKRKPEIHYQDISDMNGNQQHYVQQLIKEDRVRGFDLSQDSLIRLFIVKLAKEEYRLILSNHHIILDGWSFGIISQELFQIYNHCMIGTDPLSEKPVPFKCYLDWLKQQDKERALQFWSNYLEGYNHYVDIPFKKATINPGRAQELVLNLGKRTNQLKKFAMENNVTVNTILQSIWAILLQRYNNVQDVVFGFIDSGRTTAMEQMNKMVGLFIHTIPLRVQTTAGETYHDMITKIKADFDENEAYRYVSIADIQKNTEIKSGLINSLMVFENYPLDLEAINHGILARSGFQLGESKAVEETNYSFNLKVLSGEALTIVFDYNDGVYDREAAVRVKDHFVGIVDQLMANPDISINELELVGEKERKILIENVNNTNVPLDEKFTMQALFDYQVTENADKEAIVFHNQSMSYGELNRKVLSLASMLRDKGVGPERVVSIMVDRSFEMIIGMLAIVKAGAAYLPIDTEYPEERINYMLRDSQAQFLLTTRESIQELELTTIEFVFLEDEALYQNEVEQLDNETNLNSLAYVIYTSGTTGKPKGVMLEQKGVINLANWFKEGLGIHGNEHILQFASIAFDAFSWELTMSILLGNTLYIPTKDVILSPDLLNDYIRKNKITTVTVPPFVAAELEGDQALKRVIVAGSEVKATMIQHLLGRMEVINAYGPTEDTVCTTYYKIPDNVEGKIPIGKPITNHHVLIMDTNLKLVPIGVEGELCISGKGIARGYLGNEQLSKEKFVEHPYQKGEMLYKTGDIARWLPNGMIDYVGRMDQQVKIRGHRIEMSEIEQQMLEIASISQVAMIDKEINGMKYVCAYYVSENEILVNTLRETLKRTLPSYMIPSYFVRLDSIPLTINGKVDRDRLPTIETSIGTNAASDEELHTVEQLMVDICKKVLGLKQIGVTDNLFDLGLDSLRVAKIYKELNKVGISLSIKDIFYYETIRSIYTNCIEPKLLSNPQKDDYVELVYTDFAEIKNTLSEQMDQFNTTILNSEKTKAYSTSAIQKITWDTNRTYSGAIMEFNHEVNVEVLKKSINSVINKQSLLRSTVFMANKEMKMEEHGPVNDLDIPYVDLKNTDAHIRNQVIDYIVNELFQENLKNKNHVFHQLLYKVIILKLNHENYKIYMPFNHLIFDGMSMEIIKANIRQAYANNGIFPEQIESSYATYVDLLQSGPKEVSEDELIETFNLVHFRKSMEKFNQVFQHKSFSNTSISIGLTDDLYEQIKEMSWDVSMTIFQKILENNFDLVSIPFVMMYQDRKYKNNNYFNTIGEFLDVLPLVLRKDEEFDLTKVRKLISLANEKNVNFSTLLVDSELKKQYKKISKALKGVYSDTIHVPIFNYLSIYDSKGESEELGGGTETLSHSTELSTEITLTLLEDELKIQLFCEEQHKEEIREVIQNYIYSLRKLSLT